MAHGAILGQKLEDALLVDGSKSMQANLNMNNHKITNVANGTSNADAVNYSQLQTKLDLSGGTMTGPINMGNNKITNVANGTANTDIATVGQVNTIANAALDNLTPSSTYVDTYGEWGLGFVPYGIVLSDTSSQTTRISSASKSNNQIVIATVDNIRYGGRGYLSNNNGKTFQVTNASLMYVDSFNGYYIGSKWNSGTNLNALYSSNGTSWTEVLLDSSVNYNEYGCTVGHCKSFAVQVFNTGSNQTYITTNGRTYTQGPNLSRDPISVLSSDNCPIMYVCTEDGLYRLNSPTESSWYTLVNDNIVAVSYNNGITACVSSTNKIRYSNGGSWTSGPTIPGPTTGTYQQGISDSGQLVFVGADAVASSVDGINWQVVYLPNNNYNTGCYFNNKINIFGYKPSSSTSSNSDIYMATANAQANVLERVILSFSNAKDALNNTTN